MTELDFKLSKEEHAAMAELLRRCVTKHGHLAVQCALLIMAYDDVVKRMAAVDVAARRGATKMLSAAMKVVNGGKLPGPSFMDTAKDIARQLIEQRDRIAATYSSEVVH